VERGGGGEKEIRVKPKTWQKFCGGSVLDVARLARHGSVGMARLGWLGAAWLGSVAFSNLKKIDGERAQLSRLGMARWARHGLVGSARHSWLGTAWLARRGTAGSVRLGET
jgi:hypothetical protein